MSKVIGTLLTYCWFPQCYHVAMRRCDECGADHCAWHNCNC